MKILSSIEKRSIHLLSYSHMTIDAYAGFLVPIYPIISHRLNIDLTTAGALVALSTFFGAFMQPLYGYISDKLERRLFLIGGLLLATLFTSIIGFANHYLILGFYMIMIGLGVNIFHPQATALAAEHGKNSISHVMSKFIGFGTLGFAIGPMLASLIVDHLGFQFLFILSLPGIILSLLMWLWIPKINNKEQLPSFPDFLQEINVHKIDFILLFMIMFLRAVVILAYVTYIPFLWYDRGISTSMIGIIIGSFSLLGGLGSIMGGKIAEKVSGKKLMLITMCPSIPLLIGALQAPPIVDYFCFMIAGLCLESTIGINIVMAQQLLPRNVGIVSGILSGLCWGLAGLSIGPIGWFCTHFSISTTLFYSAFIVLLILLSVFRLSDKTSLKISNLPRS